jgi:hypothetical protein
MGRFDLTRLALLLYTSKLHPAANAVVIPAICFVKVLNNAVKHHPLAPDRMPDAKVKTFAVKLTQLFNPLEVR